MKALLRRLGFAGIVVGVVAYPLASILASSLGRDLRVVEATDAAGVEANRGLWELEGSKKEDVPGIYGTDRGVVRVAFVSEDRVFRPKEDPSQEVYLKKAGDHPFQVLTFYFVGIRAAIGGILVGGVLLFLAWRKKEPVPA